MKTIPIDVISEYRNITCKPEFLDYRRELENKISSALSFCYCNNLGELEMIKRMVFEVKKLSSRKIKDSIPISISTKAEYIHGYSSGSGVDFDYYRVNEGCELGDMIFLITLKHNRNEIVEKCTITQFKREKKNSKSVSWQVDQAQLYLLSRIPTFQGAKRSLIPNKQYKIEDYSYCLGSYGLLYDPGDFVFVSAKKLAANLVGSKTLNSKDVFKLMDCCCCKGFITEFGHYVNCAIPIDYMCHRARSSRHVLGNNHFAGNVNDFVDKYLRLCIGEVLQCNSQLPLLANNKLKDLIKDIENGLKNKTSGSDISLNFVSLGEENGNNFNSKKAASDNTERDNGKGIAIIRTCIDIGEAD